MASINNSITVSTSLRPCLVNNDKALFHGWIRKQKILFKTEMIIKTENRVKMVEEMLQRFKEENVISQPFTPMIIENNMALVELENGDMITAEPECIIFLDTKSKMLDFANFFREVDTDESE